jgi:UDP:flavonoid glycosyltransferase YjiC (YdhE family)
VVFTLGSTAAFVANDFYAQSMAAACMLGRRALLLVGAHVNVLKERLPEGVAAFAYAPYSKVFPRGCATVIAGGIGTIGLALRAGRPSLVVPHANDQFDHSARAGRLGCARVLPRSEYNAQNVARELSALLTEPRYTERANEIGRILQAEDGARAAADVIEDVLRAETR